jgi:hypothetical protein
MWKDDNNFYHLFQQSVTLHVVCVCVCVCVFCMILPVNSDYFFNRINHLISVMVKCGVLFEVDW